MPRMPALTFHLLCCLTVLSEPAFAQEAKLPIEPPMVDIPGGEFVMGHIRSPQSQPLRTVTIKPFRMGKYEVTAAEFQRFVEVARYRAPLMCIQMASKRWFANVPNDYSAATTLQSTSKFEPATCIGWNGADAYVKWLAKETGRKFRLPTEAEWEYAHRAGTTERYFFGNDETMACRYANLADRSAEAAIKRDFGLESKEHVGVIPCDDKAGYASIVGMYEPNAFGLYDTLGNVGEVLQDCWRENYDGVPSDGSAVGGTECKLRTSRGGGWHWRGPHSTARSPSDVNWIGGVAGFRVAEDLGPAGSAAAANAATVVFERELSAAQKADRARRDALAEIPASPN